MSLPKAQLVDPQGNVNLPGVSATGVITATSFDGYANTTVTGLTGNPNLNVGVVTATSFVGDGTGHAANLTGTPNLNLGLTTATSFVGDATGKAANLTGTPNLNVGLVTATSFVGDVTGDVTGNITGNVTGNIVGDVTGTITGIAGSVKQGVNLGVGVCTAISYYGDGSSLTGTASSAWAAQNVSGTTAETIVDLTYGNLIYYTGTTDTTVGFASTSQCEQVTFIRNLEATNQTGGVDFDGNDYLDNSDSSSDFDLLPNGSESFTIECFVYFDSVAADSGAIISKHASSAPKWLEIRLGGNAGQIKVQWSTNGSSWNESFSTGNNAVETGKWYHIAVTKMGEKWSGYLDGSYFSGSDNSSSLSNNTSYPLRIGARGAGDQALDGKISNLRIVKGYALYTGKNGFTPPGQELTNVAGTVLLCCQSTSSATASTVAPETMTSSGDPSAVTVTPFASTTYGFDITWPENVYWNGYNKPTLRKTSVGGGAVQAFKFTTNDKGLKWYANEVVDTSSGGLLFTHSFNNAGQLGQNKANANMGTQSSPIQVSGTWIKCGGRGPGTHGAYAITRGGGLYAWGENSNGGAAQNSTTITNYSSPTQVGYDQNWSDVKGIKSAAFGLKNDGTLWSWGTNEQGELGINKASAQVPHLSSPTQIGTETTWAKLCEMSDSDDQRSMFAIKTDGTLWGWGNTPSGRLGLNQSGPTGVSSPTQIGTETTWDVVSATGVATKGIKTDGTLWTWGYNAEGALGVNDTTQRSSPVQVPAGPAPSGKKWTSVGGAYQTTTGVKSDGTLWVWGANDYGLHGNNQSSNPAGRTSSPRQVGEDTNWKSASPGCVGKTAIGCLKMDNTLWVWGNGDDGYLGLNSQTKQSSPCQVPGRWNFVDEGQSIRYVNYP